MKILCLNVWKGALKKDIYAFIQRQVPTIGVFCLQEVEEPFREITPILDDFEEFHAQKVTGIERFDQSIFVRKSLKVQDSGTVLKEVENVGLGVWVTLVNGTGQITLCNYHGMPRPGEKNDNPERLMASEALVEFGLHKSPAVVMGDFNLRETTESVAMFGKRGFRDLIKEYNIETTRNHHNWEKYEDKQMYSDYVFVGPEVEVKNFEVLPDIVSDHQPLLVEIQ